MIINGKQTTIVDIIDAKAGDYVLQAGEWVELASVTFMRHSDNVVLGWVGGGSMSTPISHRPAVRRVVVDELCIQCEQQPAGFGHFAQYCGTCSGDALTIAAQQRDAETPAEGELIDCHAADGKCETNFYYVAARGVRALFCLDCADEAFGPQRSEAETLARVTGSVSATVTHERRLPSGELVVESVESFERVADQLDGATLPELDAETIEDERAAQERFDIMLGDRERARTISDVRTFYGEHAATLVADGWTVDGAIAHVTGTCDRELCTEQH